MYKLLNNIDFYSAEEINERFDNQSVLEEKARAEAAEQNLQEQIDLNVDNIINETNRALGVEQQLRDSIDIAKTELQTNINTAKQELQTNIDNLQGQWTDDIHTYTDGEIETLHRTMAEALAITNNNVRILNEDLLDTRLAFNTRINAEESRASEAERIINEALLVEAERSQAEDTRLFELMNDEIERASLEHVNLNNRITTEIDRATAAETSLSNRLDTTIGNIDSINQDLQNFKVETVEVTGIIDQKIAAELVRAETAEQQLQANIDINTEAIAAERLRATQEEGQIHNEVLEAKSHIDSVDTRFTTTSEHVMLCFDKQIDLPNSIDPSNDNVLKVYNKQLAYIKDTNSIFSATIHQDNSIEWTKILDIATIPGTMASMYDLNLPTKDDGSGNIVVEIPTANIINYLENLLINNNHSTDPIIMRPITSVEIATQSGWQPTSDLFSKNTAIICVTFADGSKLYKQYIFTTIIWELAIEGIAIPESVYLSEQEALRNDQQVGFICKIINNKMFTAFSTTEQAINNPTKTKLSVLGGSKKIQLSIPGTVETQYTDTDILNKKIAIVKGAECGYLWDSTKYTFITYDSGIYNVYDNDNTSGQYLTNIIDLKKYCTDNNIPYIPDATVYPFVLRHTDPPTAPLSDSYCGIFYMLVIIDSVQYDTSTKKETVNYIAYVPLRHHSLKSIQIAKIAFTKEFNIPANFENLYIPAPGTIVSSSIEARKYFDDLFYFVQEYLSSLSFEDIIKTFCSISRQPNYTFNLPIISSTLLS